MKKINLKQSTNSICLLSCLFICLVISENAFSQKKWDRNYTKLAFNKANNALDITFVFFDYDFGPASENGYLEYCDFLYSTDGVNFNHFMRAETQDQEKINNWSWLTMKSKLKGTKIQFEECFDPTPDTMWDDTITSQIVKVFNTADNWAFCSIRWYLDVPYDEVIFIQIKGLWHVNGIWPNQNIDEIYSFRSNISKLKTANFNESATPVNIDSNISNSKNHVVKVCSNPEEILISGAKHGENITIYSTSGAQLKTIVANNDVVKIKLPANQFYFVNIGQARYKVVL